MPSDGGRRRNVELVLDHEAVGRRLHEEPQVPNWADPGIRTKLKAGMILAIEPMINAGSRFTKLSKRDGWTVETRDGRLSAQWEHTVLVTETGYEVLTLSSGSPPIPAFVKPA